MRSLNPFRSLSVSSLKPLTIFIIVPLNSSSGILFNPVSLRDISMGLVVLEKDTLF